MEGAVVRGWDGRSRLESRLMVSGRHVAIGSWLFALVMGQRVTGGAGLKIGLMCGIDRRTAAWRRHKFVEEILCTKDGMMVAGLSLAAGPGWFLCWAALLWKKKHEINVAISNSFGFGRHNSFMVLANYNFSTIVSAVGAGISIYNNKKALKDFIRYMFSSDIGKVASSASSRFSLSLVYALYVSIQTIHSCALEFPKVVSTLWQMLMEFSGDSKVASATDVILSKVPLLYMNNLAYQLVDVPVAFAESGTIFMNSDTGRSAGLGFTTPSVNQPLDGQELHVCQVRVNYATDLQNRGKGFLTDPTQELSSSKHGKRGLDFVIIVET